MLRIRYFCPFNRLISDTWGLHISKKYPTVYYTGVLYEIITIYLYTQEGRQYEESQVDAENGIIEKGSVKNANGVTLYINFEVSRRAKLKINAGSII